MIRDHVTNQFITKKIQHMRQLNVLAAPGRGRLWRAVAYLQYVALYIFQTLTAMETEAQNEEKETEE